MSGYTKGPWEASDYDETGGYDCMSGGVEIRNTSTDSVIAILDAVDFGADTFEHKLEVIASVVSVAHIIAAAPDMYEALKGVLHAVDIGLVNIRSQDREVFGQLLTEVNAALSKAEGK